MNLEYFYNRKTKGRQLLLVSRLNEDIVFTMIQTGSHKNGLFDAYVIFVESCWQLNGRG